MASTLSVNKRQNCAGSFAPPGKRHPIPMIAIGSARRLARISCSVGDGVAGRDWLIRPSLPPYPPAISPPLGALGLGELPAVVLGRRQGSVRHRRRRPEQVGTSRW